MKQSKRIQKIILLCISAFLCICTCRIISYAFEYSPVDVPIQVDVNEEMDIIVANIDDGKTETHHILDTETINFHITEPGEYKYYVYQQPSEEMLKDKTVQYDTEKRHLLIHVSDKDSELSPTIIVTKTDSNTKPDSLSFENKKTPEPETPSEEPTKEEPTKEEPTTKPEEPTKPTQPTQPTQPTTPATIPTVPSNQTITSGTPGTITPGTVTEANTGDKNILIPAVVCVLALVALSVCIWVGFRKKDKK